MSPSAMSVSRTVNASKILPVLVSYPSDAREASEAIIHELEWWNSHVGLKRQVTLQKLRWPEDAVAEAVAGGDGQTVFNKTVGDAAEIVFAVFRARAGTPTQESDSGTLEEIQRAVAAHKHVHVFFYRGNLSFAESRQFDELKQLEAVENEVRALGCLVKEWTDLTDLGPLVREAIEYDTQKIEQGQGPQEMVVYQAPSGEFKLPVRVNTSRSEATAFQPRQNIYGQIVSHWERGASTVVLQGGGGFGKTQLAVHAMQEALNSDPSTEITVWADAASLAGVRRAYAEAALQLGIAREATEPDALAKLFLETLTTTDHTWLVILDNADDNFADLVTHGLIPTGNGHQGRVLITTRYHDPVVSGQGRKVVPVELFTSDEAQTFVHDRLAAERRESLVDDGLDELCRTLGYLPLGLSLASAAMARRRMTCSKYVQQLSDSKSRRELLGQLDTEGYPQSIADVWGATRDDLKVASPDGSLERAALVAALLDPSGHQARIWNAPSITRFVSGDDGREDSDATMPDELITLEDFSLVTVEGDGWPEMTVRMHPLTSLAVTDASATDQELPLKAAALAIADAYASTWPDEQAASQVDESDSVRNLVYVLHQPAAADIWDAGLYRTFLQAIRRLADRGAPNRGRDILERFLTEVRDKLGAQATETFATRSALAYCRGKSGRASLAADELETLWADEVSALGEEAPDTLLTRVDLAEWRGAAGRPLIAIDHLEAVIPVMNRVLGPEDGRTFHARFELAHCRSTSGNQGKAVNEYRALIEDQVAVLGSVDHPDVLGTRYQSAVALGGSGHPRQAAEEIQRVVDSSTAVIGPTHPKTLARRGGLARWLANSGNYLTSISTYEQLIEDQQRVLGPDHPNTLVSRHNAAHYRGRSGHLRTSIALNRVLLTDKSRAQGPDSVSVLNTRSSLIEDLAESGQIEQAIKGALDLIEDRTRILGPDASATLKSRSDLAKFWSMLGDFAQAYELQESTLSDRRRLQGDCHPSTLAGRRRLACFRSHLGELQEAIEDLEQLLIDDTAWRDPNSPATFMARHALSRCFGEAGRFDEAIAALNRLIVDETAVQGKNFLRTLKARYELAHWIGESGDIRTAATDLETLLADELASIDDDHPLTLNTRRELCLRRYQLGDTANALTDLEALERDQIRVLCASHPDLAATRDLLASWK